jgi:hypothetical protein
MKTIKYIFGFLFAAVIVLFAVRFWFTNLQYRTTALRREVTAKIENSRNSVLDLRDINSVEWDEAAYWGPYMQICDLGIKGYEPESSRCENNSESEAYIIFLSKNVAIEIVPVNRWERPFDGDTFKRLQKAEMYFQPVNTDNGMHIYRPSKVVPD